MGRSETQVHHTVHQSDGGPGQQGHEHRYDIPEAGGSECRMKHQGILVAACATVWMCGCGNVASVPPPSNVLLPAGSERYIWVSSPSPDATAPRIFRKSFSLVSVPTHATLYFFGPYNADVAVNGVAVIHLAQGGPILTNERPLDITEISSVLMIGTN